MHHPSTELRLDWSLDAPPEDAARKIGAIFAHAWCICDPAGADATRRPGLIEKSRTLRDVKNSNTIWVNRT